MSETKRYYITTPIYYVNDVPHIGHAYTSVACDVLARFKRLDSYDVMFLTGTDEHGHKVFQSASNAGESPQQFIDRMAVNFRHMAEELNLSNDDFIRTTEMRHIRACQALWQELVRNDQIYLGSYAGWYAISDEAFYSENELVDGPDNTKYAPTGAKCDWIEEPSYFFRLSQWQESLLIFYRQADNFILPSSRRNEIMSFVQSGLRDLSVSRLAPTWGIPVPGDSDHVMYVWIDALANYISALGYPERGEGLPYKRYWPVDLHMVGKDILRFHAVYWPALLMAVGLEPPRRIFAHGWWTIEAQKMSKSLGNVIAPTYLITTYGRDQTRYFLLREVPFGSDGDFSHHAMIRRINTDLANDYGNLVQRVLSIIAHRCDRILPEPGPYTEADTILLDSAYRLLEEVRRTLDVQEFHKTLEVIWHVIGQANRYVNDQAPWSLYQTDRIRMNTVLYVLAEVIRHLGILTQPFMPEASMRILDQLAVPKDQRNFKVLGPSGALEALTQLPVPKAVFPRFTGSVSV